MKDPREVVKAGDVVRVRVNEVDAPRKRIALTMKSGGVGATQGASRAMSAGPPPGGGSSRGMPKPKAEPPGESALAAALRRARGE